MITDALSRLRLATALAHSLPGGRVDLLLRHGKFLRADYDKTSGATITPCELRAMLLTRPCTAVREVAGQVETISVHGFRVVDVGGGVYRGTGDDGAPRAWFATLLAPATVGRLLDEVSVVGPPDVVQASLQPDCGLGVVVVVLAIDDVAPVEVLEEAAYAASASCCAQELVYAAQHPEVLDEDER